MPLRTTLDINDQVLERVKEYAAARSISNGAAATEILERGLNARMGIRYEDGVAVFDVPDKSPVVSLQETLRLEDEL
jgi:hypothetical protein